MHPDAPRVERLYDFLDSGNGYKVRLALTQLGIAFEYVAVDILSGETRREAFLARNPNGRIPLLALAGGAHLAESNAILAYLADRTSLLSEVPLERAETLQWMFFEQYSHEPYVAVARFWCRHPEHSQYREEELAAKRKGGHAALAVMERHLQGRDFFVAAQYSIADIALYAYTHVAEDGGISLSDYTAVGAWLSRVREQPGHIRIDQSDGLGAV